MVDGYFEDVLNKTVKGVVSVVVHPNGKWQQKDIDVETDGDDDDDYGSSGINQALPAVDLDSLDTTPHSALIPRRLPSSATTPTPAVVVDLTSD